MTCKDYIAIASTLNASYPAILVSGDLNEYDNGRRRGISDAVEALIPVFLLDNPRFDADKFRSAVFNG